MKNCLVCGYANNRWCCSTKCNCGMSWSQANLTNSYIKKYSPTDEQIQEIMTLVKSGSGHNRIMGVLGHEFETSHVTFNALCVYKSLSPSEPCQFCSVRRSEGYGKPCSYYINK